MDWAAFGKIVLEIFLAAVAGIAAVFGWVTKRFKEERLETDKRFLMVEARLTQMEANAEHRRAETEKIHRDLVEVKATLRAMPERREVAAIHAELKDLKGDLQGTIAEIRAMAKEVSRTTDFLMQRETK